MTKPQLQDELKRLRGAHARALTDLNAARQEAEEAKAHCSAVIEERNAELAAKNEYLQQRDRLAQLVQEKDNQLKLQQNQLLSMIQAREETTHALVKLILHGVQPAGPALPPLNRQVAAAPTHNG